MLFGTTCLACHGQLKRVIKPSTWVDSYASDAMTKVVCGELELSYIYIRAYLSSIQHEKLDFCRFGADASQMNSSTITHGFKANSDVKSTLKSSLRVAFYSRVFTMDEYIRGTLIYTWCIPHSLLPWDCCEWLMDSSLCQAQQSEIMKVPTWACTFY